MEQSSPPTAVGSNAGLGVVGAVQAAKFQRVPLADLTNPQKRGPLMTYQDHWWAVDDEDNVFFYKGEPLCVPYINTCSPDPGYPGQVYNSANEACDGSTPD